VGYHQRPHRRAGRLDSVEFLAQIEEAFHSFVASRLAAPLHESEEDAKRHLLKNAKQLKSLLLGEEAENLARENYKPEIEWETQTELAKEAASRVKARQGIKE
jgi:hypothetical protein